MIITRENLLADKITLSEQQKVIGHTLSYIDGLLAFLDKPEEEKQAEAA